jgi:probable rRNA maturation factor
MDGKLPALLQVELCLQEPFAEAAFGDRPEAEHPAPPPYTVASDTWLQWFQQWLAVLRPQYSPIHAYELSLRLTDDLEIQTLNANYRQQDTPTDVLAFAALEDEASQFAQPQATVPLYLGDIVISVETAQRQAIAHNHSLDLELAWLAVHGLLHLLGWDHPDDESLSTMLHQQEILLQAVGLPGVNP